MDWRLLLLITFLGRCAGVAGCSGCPVALDPKSRQALALADEVTAKVRVQKNLRNCLFRKEVYNATNQVVAGFIYELTFRAGHSKCKPPNCGKKVKKAHCQRAASIPDLTIKASIWDKPYGEMEITFEILN